MVVTTAMVGESFRKDPSLSSASATRKSPRPSFALVSRPLRRPPMTIVGSSPPSARTVASMEVVVVLPWVPATATPYLRRISSASISARGITGIRCWRGGGGAPAFKAPPAHRNTTHPPPPPPPPRPADPHERDVPVPPHHRSIPRPAPPPLLRDVSRRPLAPPLSRQLTDQIGKMGGRIRPPQTVRRLAHRGERPGVGGQ